MELEDVVLTEGEGNRDKQPFQLAGFILSMLSQNDANIRDPLSTKVIEIPPKIADILRRVLTQLPHEWNLLTGAILTIVKDNRIDSKDIPQFIIIIQLVYKWIYELRKQGVKMSSVEISHMTIVIMELIMEILISEKVVPIQEDQQAEFMHQFHMLANACASLLTFPKMLKSKKCPCF